MFRGTQGGSERMNFSLLFACFLLKVCSSFLFPQSFYNGLSLQERIDVNAVPADLVANQLRWHQYSSGYCLMLNWALEQDDSGYLEMLLRGAQSELIQTALKKYAESGTYQKISKLWTYITIDHSSWLKLLKVAATAAVSFENQNCLTTIDTLLTYNPGFTDANIYVVDDIFSGILRTSMSEFFLDHLMGNIKFPARRSTDISEGWSDVIRCAIGQNKFRFLRKLVADWEVFKRTVDLATVAKLHLPGVHVPRESRKQFYILQAIEVDNVDMVWLLAGRTTLFRTFCDPVFMNGHYGQALLEIIPELASIDWTLKRPVSKIMAEFIQTVYVSRPDNVAAQTTVLLSSTWTMPVEDYLKEALSTCSLAKILATMRAGKLKINHLPLIHMSPCTNILSLDSEDMEQIGKYQDLVDLDNQLDEYLGTFDPHSLQYKDEGPLFLFVHVLLGQSGWRARHQIVSLISSWNTMGNMAVLRALDRILLSVEFDNQLIESFPGEIALWAREDPALMLDTQQVTALLTFYMSNGYEELLEDNIDHLPVVTKCHCALALHGPIRQLLEASINHDPRVFPFLRKEIRHGALIPKFVLSILTKDNLHGLLLASAKETQPILLRMILEQLGDDISEVVWIGALLNCSLSSFFVLFNLPKATRLEWIRHYRDLIDEHILVPAVENDNQEMVSTILLHKQFRAMTCLQQRAILKLVSEHKWSTLSWFFDLIDWTDALIVLCDDNAILEALIEGGRKKLVGMMLKNKFVLETALKKPLRNQHGLYQMFPHLIDALDFEHARKTFTN